MNPVRYIWKLTLNDFNITVWLLVYTTNTGLPLCVWRRAVTVLGMNSADDEILAEAEDLVGVGAGAGHEEVQRKPSNIQNRFLKFLKYWKWIFRWLSAGDIKVIEAKVSTTAARLRLKAGKKYFFQSPDLTVRTFSPQDSGFVGGNISMIYNDWFILTRMKAWSHVVARPRNICMLDPPWKGQNMEVQDIPSSGNKHFVWFCSFFSLLF